MDLLSKINELQRSFREDSEEEQGFIHITFCNGIHSKSWGSISFRHKMSGAPMGEKYFISLDDCLSRLKELKEMQDKGELK